jgi:hypothetical protein
VEDARKIFRLLDSQDDLPPADRVILAGRQLNLESHIVGYASLAKAASAAQLLSEVKDPVARSSFRNVYGYALVSACEVDEALLVTTDQLLDAERCRLDFVVPYALVIQALAHYLRHDYALATAKVEEALERARTARDATAVGVALAAQGRIFNAQGAFGETVRRAAAVPVADGRWIQAEIEAVHAIAHAVVGNSSAAFAAIESRKAVSFTRSTDRCSCREMRTRSSSRPHGERDRARGEGVAGGGEFRRRRSLRFRIPRMARFALAAIYETPESH